MAMAKAEVFFLLVVWLAVCVGLCRCWGESVAHIAEEKVVELHHGCAETMLFAKDKADSMADWTYDKFLQNKENAGQAAQNMKDEAGDAASRATDTVKSAASGASEFLSQQSGEPKEKLSRTMAYDKTAEVYDEVDEIIRMATGKAPTYAKDIMADSVGHDGREKTAEETYDQARHRVENAHESAKDTMTEEDKVKYEDAKEKASQATGDLGAEMRMSSS